VFLDIPTGDHTLSEVPTEDIDHAFITGCTVNGEAVPLLLPIVDFPTIDLSIEAGEHWVCEWYNVPKVENRVVINKLLCDPGLDLILSEENTITEIIDSCPTEGNGIEFTLDNADGSSTQAIANGGTFWDGVPVGPFTVTESIPDGYGEPIVYCATNTVDDEGDFVPGTWHQVPAPGGVISGQMGAEYFEVFACWVLNVPAGDDGDLTVMKWICPPGYDVHAEGADPAADCTEPAGPITFQFGQPGLGEEAVLQDVGDVIEGGVRFTSLEPGTWRLVEFAPEWVASAFIGSCIVNGDPVPADPPLHEGFELDFEIEAGQTNLCHMYNVPDGSNSLTVHKKLCPVGFDVEVDNPEAECTEPMGGVTFQLGDMEATTGDDQGVALFEDVPAGEHELTEILPEGIAFAFFTHCTMQFGPILMPLVGAQPPVATLEFDVGTHWECEWYNVPEEPDPSITVEKYLCPVGYDLDAPMADPVSDCTLLLNGVTFNLDDGNPPDPDRSRQTGDDGAGTVIFPDLEPGTWTVTEEVPDGIVDAAAMCPTITGNPQVFDDPPRAVFEVADGDQFFCLWFNVPEEVEENTVIITKWECPEGADASQSHHWLSTNCTDPHDGVEFEITTDFGWVVMETVGGSLQLGPIGPMFHVEIQENIPDGFGDPAVYCAVDDGPHVQIGAPGGYWEHDFADDGVGETLSCEVYNIPDEENTVLILKWQCPEGTGLEESVDWYGENCTEEHDGVDFKLASDLGIAVQETSGGQVQFDGLPAGGVSIQETIPDGFGAPIVFCATENSLWQLYDAPTGHWEYDFPDDGVSEVLTCWVFNIPGEPPDLTILKWTCPEGYDLFAAGADPATDCTEATNGVGFQLGPDEDGALAELQTTGDVIDGGVLFDDLEPGLYKAVEVVPEGIASAFVLECTGHIMGMLQPNPLQIGNVLDGIDLDAGEHLICHWYNVPGGEGGDLTLIKYVCATETFVDEVDCEIYEDGATFDLSYWTGTWDLVDTATTDGVGRIQWTGLEPGEYWFEEHDGEWCHIASDLLYEDGPWVIVNEGQETVVHIYNCDPDWDATTIPQKYPNTGAPPSDGTPGATQTLPASAALAATLLSRRRFAALVAGSVGLLAAGVLAQDDEQAIEPVDGTPVAGDARPCLPATPAPAGDSGCARGAVPATLRIEAIGVDAPVEVLETVGGVMQQPTDEIHVAWYKESARLGEIGNSWVAGHLNWVNTPVAVFSDLGLLREGDEVTLLDDDDNAFTYTVEWVRQESNLAPPTGEVLGMTDHQAVTLITCGGKWDNTISEYDQRTVVRARRVLDAATPTAPR
jgi:sortase (surface protein transpeptidase)